MLLVEIEPIGFQPLQAGFDRPHDVGARGALLLAALIHRHGEFGRQHDVLAAGAENFADERLGSAFVAVNIGGIKQRDAEVQRLMNHLARAVRIEPHPEIVAAEADFGD